MLIGVFLILFGSLMLLDRLGWIDIHLGQYILPVILIALGAAIMSGKKRRDKTRTPKT